MIVSRDLVQSYQTVVVQNKCQKLKEHIKNNAINFPKTHKSSLVSPRSLKLGHFFINDMFLLFLASILHHDRLLWLTDTIMQRAYFTHCLDRLKALWIFSPLPCHIIPYHFSTVIEGNQLLLKHIWFQVDSASEVVENSCGCGKMCCLNDTRSISAWSGSCFLKHLFKNCNTYKLCRGNKQQAKQGFIESPIGDFLLNMFDS